MTQNLEQDKSTQSLDHIALQQLLRPVAKRLSHILFLDTCKNAFWVATLAVLVLSLITLFWPVDKWLLYGLLGIVFLSACAFVRSKTAALPLPLENAARSIESAYPSTRQTISTAWQIAKSGKHNFLTQKLAAEALESLAHCDLAQIGKDELKRKFRQTIYCIASFAAAATLFHFLVRQETDRNNSLDTDTASVVFEEILPGGTSVEQGSSLVITARFGGEIPSDAELIVTENNAKSTRYRMIKSLSDPIFTYTLTNIRSEFSYYIEANGTGSEVYDINVFQRPSIQETIAQLQYPSYTNLRPQSIADTRHIKAVQGTDLSYEITANKPLRSAFIEWSNGDRSELFAIDSSATRFGFDMELSRSVKGIFHLEDTDGYESAVPYVLNLEALPNTPPSLRFISPMGDQRFSPLEEIALRGEIADDFGIIDYGIAYSVGPYDAIEESFRSPFEEQGTNPTYQEIERWLYLESMGMQVGEIITWYLWADDYDKDGNSRRTTGDLYFGEIRALDEIYREQDPSQSRQNQQSDEQGGGLESLVETQRQISIALFRMMKSNTPSSNFQNDLISLYQSQSDNESRLSEVLTILQAIRSRQVAVEAMQYMSEAQEHMNRSMENEATPLNEAWASSQGALQDLIKLAEGEYNISRSQNSNTSGQDTRSRNQSQLNELRFRQEENRYETASQAEPLNSIDSQKESELLNRLQELSQRQQDMNRQIQELQSAMATAQSEADKEEIERELRRLEENQKDLLSDLDQAMQQTPQSEKGRQLQNRLSETREDMRETSEHLEQGRVSEALASGNKAQQSMDTTRESMRETASSQFEAELDRLRKSVQTLSTDQQEIARRVAEASKDDQQRLEAAPIDESIAEDLEGLASDTDRIVDQLKDIIEKSEVSEPALHRTLYDLLRQQGVTQIKDRLLQDAQRLREGAADYVNRSQDDIAERIQALSQTIENASASIMGSNEEALRYAENQLEELTSELDRELQRNAPSSAGATDNNPERNSNSQNTPTDNASSSSSNEDISSIFSNAANNMQEGQAGPLTGDSFKDWIQRLRNLEDLVTDDDMRLRLSQAREAAEGVRVAFMRHGETPKWEWVEAGISKPLEDVKKWIRQELIKSNDPRALQPLDRDPVPPTFEEAVRRYYQNLGTDLP